MNHQRSHTLLIALFFTFFALALTSPLASFRYTVAGDFSHHAKSILLAKKALAEFQFPLRIAPDLLTLPRYPLFQFYAPFPYLVAGLLYKFIFTGNPYITYKLLTWLALILGGVYIYRIANLLTHNPRAALLAGLAYQLSPYWIINTNIRTDFTESLAQGLLPIALFYSLRMIKNQQRKNLILATVLWALIAMTHLVTFAYSLGFFLVLTTLWSMTEKISWRAFGNIVVMLVWISVLVLWFLLPILLLQHWLVIDREVVNPFWSNIFTPLTNLISLQSISPTPLAPDKIPDYINPAFGYPILLAVGILIYAFYQEKKFYQSNHILIPLLMTFLLAVFVTWSPIDIWRLFPRQLVIFQFTYRLLTQVMWTGALLFAFAIHWLFKKEISDTVVVLIICLLVIGNSSWLHNQRNDHGDTINSEIIHNYGGDLPADYQAKPIKLSSPLLLSNTQLLTTCNQQHQNMLCQINQTSSQNIALPMLWFPKLIHIEKNHQELPYQPTMINNQVFVGLTLPPGQYTIKATFTGIRWANWISLLAWLITGYYLFFNKSKKHRA